MFVVFDIGGTMTKFAVFENDELPFMKGEFPSLASQGGSVMLERLFEEVDHLKEKLSIQGIAISTAGQINPVTGTVIYATDSIPDYTGTQVKTLFEERFNVPVSVENDVNCFLLGEVELRSLNEPVLALTLGTGIGGALYLNQDVFRGATFSAGEIGHIQLIKEGKRCSCGSRGCYEQYASTKALKARVEELMGTDDLIAFFESCKTYDQQALDILVEWVDFLTDGLKNLIHVINPSKVIIGGAVAAQGTFIEQLIEESLYDKLIPSFAKDLKIIVSRNGNLSNLIGAMRHFKNCNPQLF